MSVGGLLGIGRERLIVSIFGVCVVSGIHIVS